MNRFSATRFLTIAAALAASAVLAACGGSDAKEDDGSAGLKGEPIKVMTIYPKGGAVPLPDIPNGAKTAVKAVNKAGGIDGRPVKLIVCSDGNNANTAADCGRQAVNEGVVALLGSSSTYSTTYLPIVEQKQIPSIGNGAASTADFVSAMSYPLGGGPAVVFGGLPRFLADQGAKKIVLVRPDLAPAANAVKNADAALKFVDQKIVGEVPVPISAPDMSSYVEQVASQNADGVVIILPGTQSIAFVEGLRQSAPDVKIALASTEKALYKALGEKIEGIVSTQDALSVPAATPPTAVEFGKEMKDAGFDSIDTFGVNAWMSVHALADLAKDMPTISGPALVKKLNTVAGVPTGLTPPAQWRVGNIGGVPRGFTGCGLAMKYTADGTKEPVTGKFFDVYKNRACITP